MGPAGDGLSYLRARAVPVVIFSLLITRGGGAETGFVLQGEEEEGT